MPVYLPTAAVGSSKLLATLGHSGELMTLFFPHLDYAQNVRECMPALWLDDDRRRGLTWTFGDEWTREQAYEPDANVVVTKLHQRDTDLSLELTDFAVPETAALVRGYRLENEGRRPVAGALFFYADFNLGEVADRNFLRFDREAGVFVHSWREYCCCVGGTPFDEILAGRAADQDAANAKVDMEDGHLGGQAFSLGDANLAGSWRFSLQPGERLDRTLLIVCSTREAEGRQLLTELAGTGFETLRNRARDGATEWLAQFRTPAVEAGRAAEYRRGLLAMSLLFDPTEGSCLAAPEFDPTYLESGGYGYCWPRDAAEFVEALCLAGSTDWAERFLQWCRRTQTAEGFWHQRYWLNGTVAPSWSIPGEALQIDQVGAVLHSLWVAWKATPAARREALLDEHWDWLARGMQFIEKNLQPDGLHVAAYDLRETFRGSFAYSNAALYGAFTGGAELAASRGEVDLATRWRERAQRLRSACLARLVDGDRFARGLNEWGEVDWTPDSSVLGMVDPFDMLDPADAADREILKRMVLFIEQNLQVNDDRGPTVRRYVGDAYVGGPASAVNTLWQARILFRLAQHEPAAGYLTWGKQYLDSCLAHATPTGLLPELLGAKHPYWAAPHGWAEGSLVRAILELEKAQGVGAT